MKSSDIRKKFLKFFEGKGHKVLPGSSLIPSDPTVLLTLAGMLQFKPVFLGIEKPKHKRVTTVQKCIRMNDIEKVGRTSRHQTFFEMLGNFSFGDYFKKEAVLYAWELLTKEFGLPKERLLIAVYEKDNEAFDIWKNDIGVPPERIFRLGEDNNFWAAGATGPCGPCSEIYYDLGAGLGCGKKGCAPGCDCDRFLEVWNLVFIQYNRDEHGNLHELPLKNIDTGMGLERISSILQGVQSNFGTDLFRPIIEGLDEYIRSPDDRLLESKRIIADHIRAIVHLMSDSVVPGNDGRGYVLRRLIRRAILHGKRLGINEPFLHKLAAVVSDVNGAFYPEVKKEIKFVASSIRTEEEHFMKTLESGLSMLNGMIRGGAKVIPGKDVFLLHDTYGFPFDLTLEIASESGVKVDEEGFRKLMEGQKEMGRSSGMLIAAKHYMEKLAGLPETKFAGYTSLSTDAKIVHVDEGDGVVVLDKTVFYPEGGGQVGDVGKITAGSKDYEVIGTFGRIGEPIAHQLKSVKGLKKGSAVKAAVDHEKRKLASAHHTATHLLHAALRELFGKSVKQSGSYVSPDGFRFDFTHFGGISRDDIDRIERRVNELIKAKMKVEVEEAPISEAQKRGALMFFGEKYGDVVRMIKIEDFSLELCGGTHVRNTSEISFFKLVSESSISSGVRRIEAKVSDSAKKYVIECGTAEWDKNKQMFGKYETLELKKELLEGKPETYYQFFRITADDMESLNKAVAQGNVFLINRMLEDFRKKNAGLVERMEALEHDTESENLQYVSDNLNGFMANAVDVNGIKAVKCEFKHYSAVLLRQIADMIKKRLPSSLAALFSVQGERVALVVSLSDDLVQKGLDAGVLAKKASAVLGGGGGGRKDLAEGGGKHASKVQEAFDAILASLKERP